nr:PREDICTED: odorant receptor 22b-like [Megachile rotundata]
MMYSLFVAQSLDIAFHVTNLDEFSDNFATTSLLLVDCIKHGVLSMRRDSLIELTDMLSKNLFASVTKREIKIRERYDKLVELNTNLYAICFFGGAVFAFVTTTIIDFKKRRLIVSVWLPYNYSSATLYLLTSAYEWVAGEYAIMTSAACDCLYIGLLLHICGQIKVLEHRFQTLTEEGYYSLNQCAAHHYNIYQFVFDQSGSIVESSTIKWFAKMVNKKFTEVMFFQFAARMLIETLIYSFGTFAQIAYYCWFSNEVKLKSIEFADEIFYSDWVSWGNEAKKVFLMVLTRSAQPIEFSCISILPINLESFMKLLKTSYSAFNIMQQSR